MPAAVGVLAVSEQSVERDIGSKRAALLGIFAVVAILGAGFALFALAGQEGIGQSKLHLSCAMPTANGLKPGTRVRVLGMPVGQVADVVPPEKPGQPVIVHFWLASRSAQLVRADATGRVVKDGLVGERFLDVDPGSPDFPPALDGARIASKDAPDWDGLVTRIDGIVRDVQAGKGTVGKLLRDEAMHDSIGKLIEKTDKVVGAIDENYSSVKQSSFVGRWMKDRYELLVRPDCKTHRKVLGETELFEPGKAVLVAHGVEALDNVAAWIREYDAENCELLIAGFAGDEPNGRLAELTTQKQAQAVLEYLKTHQKIHKTGWFSRRTTSAYGFGNLPSPDGATERPARRVEITIFEK